MSDEKDSSARNAGGDARAVVVAAWPTTSSEPRVARALFSSPLSPASELSDSECVTSSEEDDIVTTRTGCPPGLGNARGVSSRRATAASPGARASRDSARPRRLENSHRPPVRATPSTVRRRAVCRGR